MKYADTFPGKLLNNDSLIHISENSPRVFQTILKGR